MGATLKLRTTSTPPAAGGGRTVIGSNLSNTQVDENFLALDEDKLSLSGGTMTGYIVLHADPVSGMQAATKTFVESTAAAAVAAHTSDTTDAHAASAITNTPAGGIAATTVQAALDELDSEKLAKAGGTMTGSLVLNADPSSAMQAATKQYVDNSVPVLAASGVTVTPAGNIASTNVQAALQELDSEKQASLGYTPVNKAGDTMTGLLTLSGDPSSVLHAVTKQYADALVSGVTRKNYVINGNFDVWQTDTSFTPPATTRTRTADCWWAQRSSNAGYTISQVDGTMSRYALKMQRTLGNTATNAIKISQSIETNVAALFGKLAIPMTLSFYAKKGANYSGGNLTFYAQRGTGTDENVLDGYSGSLLLGSAGSATLTTSLQRFSYTFTPDSSTNELGFRIEWSPSGTAGSDDSVTIENVKLEFGSAPTEFVADTFAETLLKCKRYYQKSFDYYTPPAQNVGSSLGALQWTAIKAGNVAQGVWLFPLEVEMLSSALTATGYSPLSNDNGWYNETRAVGNLSWTMAVTPKRVAVKPTGASSGTAVGDICSLHLVVYNANF